MRPIRATLRPISLSLHEMEVQMTLPAELMRAGCTLSMPTWTPGSYLIRDHARFVDRVRLLDAGGEPLGIQKTGKASWELESHKGEATLTYRLYANELSVRTNHVDGRQAHLVGAALFLFPEGSSGRPWDITFDGWPSGWSVATPLPCEDGVYHASDMDTLVDTPFALGPFTRHMWEQGGARFAFVISGTHAVDMIRVVDGTRRIIDVCADLFRGLPFDHYAFLLTFSPGADGGLEHRHATSLLADPVGVEGPEARHDLFCLIAHEFFHAWNVKRMRPPELCPIDYTQECPTRLLWFYEGLTNFMHHVLVTRAGVVTWNWVVRQLSGFWTDFTTRPGRHEQSLEEASFDAWIRAYKPTEASVNTTVNYYGKGTLIGWLMDAELRLASEGRTGVPELFSMLWQRYGDGPLDDGAIQTAFEALGGTPEVFWGRYIQGTAELDPTSLEQAYGLTFQQVAPWDNLDPERAADPDSVARAAVWSGIAWEQNTNRIRAVMPGAPAAEAGLSYGMEILAVQGWRTLTAQEVQARFADAGVGGTAEVLAAERGRVDHYRVCLAENPIRSTRIVPQPSPTAVQRVAFEGLFGIPHPASEPRKGRRK